MKKSPELSAAVTKFEKKKSATCPRDPPLLPTFSPVTHRPPFRFNALKTTITECNEEINWKPPSLKLCDAPDKTGALLFAHHIRRPRSVSPEKVGPVSPEYRKFLSDGTRTKDGSNHMSYEEKTFTVFSERYMPSLKKSYMTMKLQESTFFENELANKIDPRPLRHFGRQDRPHHVPKDRNISQNILSYH